MPIGKTLSFTMPPGFTRATNNDNGTTVKPPPHPNAGAEEILTAMLGTITLG